MLIYDQKPQQCDLCGEIKELRPYGPPGARMICVTCGDKDPETKSRFFKVMEEE